MALTKSFEEMFHETRPGLYWRLWRDVRCFAFLAIFVLRNLIIGSKVRRRYLACKASGEPFWLDEETPKPEPGGANNEGR